MKPNEKFSDATAREIKANMVAGVSLVALGRIYGCSTETLRKMKAGLTYKHVTVLGEEGLRPEVKMVAPTERHLEVLSGKTDEDLQASQERVMAELARDMQKERVVGGAVDEVMELAQKLLGNTPVRGTSI